MNKFVFSVPLLILLFALLIAFRYFTPKDVQPVAQEQTATTTPSATNTVAIANPASTFCIEKGGSLQMQTKEDGSQYGLCYFDDARACEEWAMLREECPIGGVKTTGYDTVDQKFCAWSGGRTFAVENSQCTFANGKVCPTIDFYNGTCTK